MTTTITCSYHVAQGGAALTALQSAVAAVPVPQDLLTAFALRVTSDSTTIGSGEVIRTIVFSMVPSSTATATAQVNSNQQLTGVTVTAPGANYVKPPVVSFVGTSVFPPKARAGLKIVAATVASAGSSYTANAKAVLVGGLPASEVLAPNQRPSTVFPPNDPTVIPAVLTLTIVGGHITGVAITNAGSGYTTPPEVVIEDTIGSGGAITLSMGVSDVVVDYRGEGVFPAPTVVLTPAYKSTFPDGSNQGAPLANIMTTVIAQAVFSPVVASTPIVA